MTPIANTKCNHIGILNNSKHASKTNVNVRVLIRGFPSACYIGPGHMLYCINQSRIRSQLLRQRFYYSVPQEEKPESK